MPKQPRNTVASAQLEESPSKTSDGEFNSHGALLHLSVAGAFAGLQGVCLCAKCCSLFRYVLLLIG